MARRPYTRALALHSEVDGSQAEEEEERPAAGQGQGNEGKNPYGIVLGFNVRHHEAHNAQHPPPTGPGFRFVPLEDEDWDELQQQENEIEKRRLDKIKRRKLNQFGDNLGMLKELVHDEEDDEEDEEDAGDQADKQSSGTLSTAASVMELRKGEHNEFCFFCRFSQDPFEQEQDPRYQQMLQIIEDNYGRCKMVKLARMVSRFYIENFTSKRGRSQHWSLRSIIYHIEKENPTDYVRLTKSQRRVATMQDVLVDENMVMHKEDGSRTLNSTAVKIYRELLKDELLLIRERRELRGRSSMF